MFLTGLEDLNSHAHLREPTEKKPVQSSLLPRETLFPSASLLRAWAGGCLGRCSGDFCCFLADEGKPHSLEEHPQNQLYQAVTLNLHFHKQETLPRLS